MSDQNFLDEDVDNESSPVSAKRMKTVAVDTCVNDQVLYDINTIWSYSECLYVIWFSIHEMVFQVVPSDRYPINRDATVNSIPADWWRIQLLTANQAIGLALDRNWVLYMFLFSGEVDEGDLMHSNSHKPVTKSRKGKISRNDCSTMKEEHGVWREREGEAMNRIIRLFWSTEIMKNVVCCNSSSFFSLGDGCACVWYMDWQKPDYSP